jgi:hypothetical protein
MNNLELIAHATTIFQKPSFNPRTSLLIKQILASKKCAVPTYENQNVGLRLGLETAVVFSHVLLYLNATYGVGQYTHHSLCFHQEVPFRIHRSTINQVDDSALIYSDQSNILHLGVIVGIVRLRTTDQVVFIIDKANIYGCDSFLLDGVEYMNDLFIDATLLMPRETASIKFEFIKKKVAYRVDENSSLICGFQIFPNLLEST